MTLVVLTVERYKPIHRRSEDKAELPSAWSCRCRYGLGAAGRTRGPTAAADLGERPIDLPFLGAVRRVRLSVRIDEEGGIEPQHVEAYRDFMKPTGEYMGNAEKAILKYDRSVCDDYRGIMGIEAGDDERVPLIKSVGEFERLVTLAGVHFNDSCDEPTCGLLCECTWGEEHGLGVLFERGKVTEVGHQDVVL